MTLREVSGQLAPSTPALAGDLNVRGLVLQPGTFTPYVGGKPQTVRLTRAFVLAAYDAIRRDVRAGRVAMRLAHPGHGDMPLKWGRVKDVGIDRVTARVFVTDSEALPEVAAVLTPEAHDRLWDMGLSLFGRIRFREDPHDASVLVAQDLVTLEAVDIVTEGAFTGRGISRSVPLGVAAALAQLLPKPQNPTHPPNLNPNSVSNSNVNVTATPRPGENGPATPTHPQETGNTMPQLESVEQIPEDARAALTPEQQAVYLAAYNQAIETGTPPDDAHQHALQAAQQHQAQPTNTPPLTMPAVAAPPMAAAASKSKTSPKEARTMTKDVEAAVAAKDAVIQEMRAQLATMETQVKDLHAHKQRLEDEKAQREVEADVTDAIGLGRVTPAMRPQMTAARKALGADGFRDLVKVMPRLVHPGEKAHAAQTVAAKDAHELEHARGLVERHTAAGVVRMGLHEVTPRLADVLLQEHASDPEVRRVSAKLQRHTTAKKGGEG